MISKQMTAALNEQINKELYSSYLYAAMSAWAEFNNLGGAAAWLKVQAGEEMSHAYKFYGYMVSQGAPVKLAAIAAPPAEYASLLNLFEEVLKHEQHVTAAINSLADLADKDKDRATALTLQWFITEQVEEEESVTNVIAKLKMVGNHPGGLYMMDRELAMRAAKG